MKEADSPQTHPVHSISMSPSQQLANESYPSESYQPPRVTDLGQWAAVTLIYSLPVGPGGKVQGMDNTF